MRASGWRELGRLCLGAVTRSCRRFMRRDEAGVAVLTGITFTLVVGGAALGAEVGMWLVNMRSMQETADIAAVTAALAGSNLSQSTYVAQAKNSAAMNGYVDSAVATAQLPSNATVIVNIPPTLGNFTENNKAIEVIIEQTPPSLFASLFLPNSLNPLTLSVRAVAAPAGGGDCVVALDQNTADNGISASGNGTMTLSGCGFTDNSSISISGNGHIVAANAAVRGTVSANSSNLSPYPPETLSSPRTFTGPTLPTPGPCTPANTAQTISNNATISGTYCNGLSISAHNKTITVNGTVIIYGGALSISNGTVKSGANGGTFVLTGSASDGYSPTYATISVTGQGSLNSLTAPTTGSLAGYAIIQDPNAPQSASGTYPNSIAGNANLISGTIYIPKQGLSYAGNGGTPSCTALVAFEVQFTGNGTLQANCGPGGGFGGNTHTTLGLVE